MMETLLDGACDELMDSTESPRRSISFCMEEKRAKSSLSDSVESDKAEAERSGATSITAASSRQMMRRWYTQSQAFYKNVQIKPSLTIWIRIAVAPLSRFRISHTT